MNFEFATATRIIFGPGKLEGLGDLAKSMGTQAFIVTGLSDDLTNPLIDILTRTRITSQIYQVKTEPTIELVKRGVDKARKYNCDIVIGFGGGSAMDAGKAIAALATNFGEILDYLEVIGKGLPLINSPIPYIAIPTTAGTGAEVTRNAVLASPEQRVKVSLRSPWMLPKLAIIDPELTISLPPSVTSSTGLDALTQCIEPYVSHLSNPLTDSICREGIRRVAGSLLNAFKQPTDLSSRTDMSLASLFGGISLANAKLGAVHGFAGPLGGMYLNAPHGVICGRLLPFVIKTNVKSLQSREPQNPALKRYDEVARILTWDRSAKALDGVAYIQELADELNVPPLSDFGIVKDDFPTIIEKAQRASSMKGNPIVLKEDELHQILMSAF